MKLTKKQRAEVVELLRCAADLGFRDRGLLLTASTAIDAPLRIEVLAMDAWRVSGLVDDDATALLEAARLVEEGSWP